MPPNLTLIILGTYFSLLLVVAYYTSKNATAQSFFTANRQSPWYLVAFGMIGASLSGVTFISIPGAVVRNHFSYFQVVLGYIVGYSIIATVLLPLYYRLNLISIYTYLKTRFGEITYKTGASFFLLSRTIGTSFRLFLAVEALQIGIFEAWGFPFWCTTSLSIALIWVYTFRGGIKTIVWTDTLQTTFLVGALLLSVLFIKNELGLSLTGLIDYVASSDYSEMFFWDNFPGDRRHFVKQFLTGIFISLAMTGLDQDMMQKNLTCKNIGEAQKNMFVFVGVLVVVNLIFLSLGALIYLYANAQNIALPQDTDQVYAFLAFKYFNVLAGVAFLLGITAATYASSDSALTSLTTSFCIDFLRMTPDQARATQQATTIRWVHLGFSVLLLLIVVVFKWYKTTHPESNIIGMLFTASGFTYGPLLGLFSFGLITKRLAKDHLTPIVCLIAPVISFIIFTRSKEWWGYVFDSEIIIVNGLLTFVGLWAISTDLSRKIQTSTTTLYPQNASK